MAVRGPGLGLLDGRVRRREERRDRVRDLGRAGLGSVAGVRAEVTGGMEMTATIPTPALLALCVLAGWGLGDLLCWFASWWPYGWPRGRR